MTFYVVAVFCIFFIVSVNSASTYNDKYDKIDLDAIIKNDRLFKNYVDCLLDKSGCRPDGLELKSILPDALKNDCEKCTEAQKNGSRKIIRHLIKNKRDWFNKLEAKYDPKRAYITRYSEELKKEGISL